MSKNNLVSRSTNDDCYDYGILLDNGVLSVVGRVMRVTEDQYSVKTHNIKEK